MVNIEREKTYTPLSQPEDMGLSYRTVTEDQSDSMKRQLEPLCFLSPLVGDGWLFLKSDVISGFMQQENIPMGNTCSIVFCFDSPKHIHYVFLTHVQTLRSFYRHFQRVSKFSYTHTH